jgi:hypothetical protein
LSSRPAFRKKHKESQIGPSFFEFTPVACPLQSNLQSKFCQKHLESGIFTQGIEHAQHF